MINCAKADAELVNLIQIIIIIIKKKIQIVQKTQLMYILIIGIKYPKSNNKTIF